MKILCAAAGVRGTFMIYGMGGHVHLEGHQPFSCVKILGVGLVRRIIFEARDLKHEVIRNICTSPWMGC